MAMPMNFHDYFIKIYLLDINRRRWRWRSAVNVYESLGSFNKDDMKWLSNRIAGGAASVDHPSRQGKNQSTHPA